MDAVVWTHCCWGAGHLRTDNEDETFEALWEAQRLNSSERLANSEKMSPWIEKIKITREGCPSLTLRWDSPI